MQEKESIMVVWNKLKIPSFRKAVRHHSTSLAMPNSYPHDRIFNSLLTAIKILIIKKMCNVRTFVTHKYEMFCTYITYENVLWPNLFYTQKMISCICTFLHTKCVMSISVLLFSEFGQLHIKMFQKVQER